jgi:hypothetical protein
VLAIEGFVVLPRPQQGKTAGSEDGTRATGVGCSPSPEYSLRSANREPNVTVL